MAAQGARARDGDKPWMWQGGTLGEARRRAGRARRMRSWRCPAEAPAEPAAAPSRRFAPAARAGPQPAKLEPSTAPRPSGWRGHEATSFLEIGADSTRGSSSTTRRTSLCPRCKATCPRQRRIVFSFMPQQGEQGPARAIQAAIEPIELQEDEMHLECDEGSGQARFGRPGGRHQRLEAPSHLGTLGRRGATAGVLVARLAGEPVERARHIQVPTCCGSRGSRLRAGELGVEEGERLVAAWAWR